MTEAIFILYLENVRLKYQKAEAAYERALLSLNHQIERWNAAYSEETLSQSLASRNAWGGEVSKIISQHKDLEIAWRTYVNRLLEFYEVMMEDDEPKSYSSAAQGGKNRKGSNRGSGSNKKIGQRKIPVVDIS